MFESVKKKLVRLGFALTCISFVLALVSKSDFSLNWEVTTLQAFQLPMNFMVRLIPILFVIWFFIELKASKFKESNLVFLFIFITTFAFMSTFYTQTKHTVYASGYAEIEYKIMDVDGYIVQIGQKRLLCNPEDYHIMELNKRYKVIYEWQKHKPNDGILRHVEVVNSD